MAYININTFDILETPIKENVDNYFECDEFIAPIISSISVLSAMLSERR